MKERFEDFVCVEWLGCLWHIYCWDVCVNLIWFMVFFSQRYLMDFYFCSIFKGGSKSGFPYRMINRTHRYRGELLWIFQKSCDCVHSCTLVRVGTTTLLTGNRILFQYHVQPTNKYTIYWYREGGEVFCLREACKEVFYLLFYSIAFPE